MATERFREMLKDLGAGEYATAETAFDFTATYTAYGYGGVAFRATGYEEVADEDTEWTGMLVRTGRIVAHMVGDDRDFTFDVDDLTVLDEDDYCAECGQIGCTADGRERDADA